MLLLLLTELCVALLYNYLSARAQPFPPQTVAQIFFQTLDAVAYLHRHSRAKSRSCSYRAPRPQVREPPRGLCGRYESLRPRLGHHRLVRAGRRQEHGTADGDGGGAAKVQHAHVPLARDGQHLEKLRRWVWGRVGPRVPLVSDVVIGGGRVVCLVAVSRRLGELAQVVHGGFFFGI